MGVAKKPEQRMLSSYLFILLATVYQCSGFCFHQGGGVGEYSKECMSDMEACYARCNCWTDFPDMGGQITHEVDAWCFQSTCYCSYDQSGCPYGTLKTNPYCCSHAGITCDDVSCDHEGVCWGQWSLHLISMEYGEDFTSSKWSFPLYSNH